jgi:hypothetical protein
MKLADLLHEACATVRMLGSQKQMDVVGHQAIGVQRAARMLQQSVQMEQIEAAILDRKEASRAVVTSLNDMQGNAGKHEARAARHAGINERALATLTNQPKNVVCP